MKTFRTLALVSALTFTTGVQAAAIGNIGIYIDWSTLSITGVAMTPAIFTDPQSGQSLSSDGEGWVGNEYGDLDASYAINGASAIASFSDTILSLVGGYDATGVVTPVPDASGGSVNVSNIGPGVQSGYAGGWRGMFYQATGTGQVTISVDYSLGGDVSTDLLVEYSTAGYGVFMDAVDADMWLTTYTAAIDSGSTIVDAELAAEAAAVLDQYTFDNWNLLSCSGELCSDTSSLSGTMITDTMSVTFDVTSGNAYAFGADASVSVYTDVGAVPVPAAVWLFGSGLIGLVVVARRKSCI